MAIEKLESRSFLAADIASGLVHHWPFDETGSANTAVDIAGGSNGTLVNWSSAEPKWEPGRVGGALRFASPDNYVIAQPPAMTGSYAVSFWLNVADRSGTNPRILTARSGNEIVVNNDRSRSVGYYYAGTREATADPSAPSFNTWDHYAINMRAPGATSGEGEIYRNGQLVATGGFVDSASLASWVIGHSTDLANTTDSLSGALDDLRIYNRSLSQEDILALASLGTAEPTHVEPIHYWPFDEQSGDIANDVTGDADGTLRNWTPTEQKWVSGKIGGALAFRTADNMVVTTPAEVRDQWSVSFWVNVQGRGGVNPRIIGPDDGRELWAYLDLENNGGGAFLSHEQRTSETSPIPRGTWEHYAFNYDTAADKTTIYHNGVQVAVGPFHDNAVRQPWVFGHNRDPGNHTDTLDGWLDELRVYDRHLSLTEIRQLAGLQGPSPTAPKILSLSPPATISEGQSYTLTGEFQDVGFDQSHTVTIHWGLGEGSTTLTSTGPNPPLTSLTRLSSDTWQFSATHRYLDDNPTGTPSDNDSIQVEIRDQGGESTTAGQTITVANADPQILGLTGPAGAARGETIVVGGSFSDLGTLDIFSGVVLWGDGTSTPFSASPATGLVFSAAHVYAVQGHYEITVRVTDDDGGTAISSPKAVIITESQPGARLRAGALEITGSAQDDNLALTVRGNRLIVNATFGSLRLNQTFKLGNIHRVVASLGDGDDALRVDSKLRARLLVDAGRGDDNIRAGGAASLVLGGGGNDLLYGGSARDVLIGGDGRDQLWGYGGSDLLIAAATIYDSDQQALTAILSEWASGRPFGQRVNNLRAGSGPILGRAGVRLQPGETVLDDDEVDSLMGNGDNDWFIVSLSQDKRNDRAERLN